VDNNILHYYYKPSIGPGFFYVIEIILMQLNYN
jgi:hypothetical protein